MEKKICKGQRLLAFSPSWVVMLLMAKAFILLSHNELHPDGWSDEAESLANERDVATWLNNLTQVGK